jgi:hypothetical protein
MGVIDLLFINREGEPPSLFYYTSNQNTNNRAPKKTLTKNLVTYQATWSGGEPNAPSDLNR